MARPVALRFHFEKAVFRLFNAVGRRQHVRLRGCARSRALIDEIGKLAQAADALRIDPEIVAIATELGIGLQHSHEDGIGIALKIKNCFLSHDIGAGNLAVCFAKIKKQLVCGYDKRGTIGITEATGDAAANQRHVIALGDIDIAGRLANGRRLRQHRRALIKRNRNQPIEALSGSSQIRGFFNLRPFFADGACPVLE